MIYKLYTGGGKDTEDMSDSQTVHVKDFSGYRVVSGASCCQKYNNKVVERTIRKAFPTDRTSTLYVVKVKGVRDHLALYEDEMIAIFNKEEK